MMYHSSKWICLYRSIVIRSWIQRITLLSRVSCTLSAVTPKSRLLAASPTFSHRWRCSTLTTIATLFSRIIPAWRQRAALVGESKHKRRKDHRRFEESIETKHNRSSIPPHPNQRERTNTTSSKWTQQTKQNKHKTSSTFPPPSTHPIETSCEPPISRSCCTER
jgi:hypothetical protein